MRTGTILIAALLAALLIHSVSADQYIFDSSLYGVEDLEVNIDISSRIYHEGDVSSITASLLYFPHRFDGQDVLSEATNPQARREGQGLVYSWTRPSNPVELQYDARVASRFHRPEITEAVAFPYGYVPPEAQGYLRSEEIIRITPEIRQLASDIIGEEDDAMMAIFEVGKWVKDNIEYDLSTVTAEASQPSDWVLDQRRGVCDELTSLFIAMLRSQGIPARFVSGIAYTNLESLESPWGPHGWAEVWVPGHGWVPYDVTYGQFGFVDATHIGFISSADARSNAIEYVMQSRDGYMEPDPLQREVTLTRRGDQVGDDVRIEIEPAIDEIGFGGANRLDVTVENLREHYVSLELFLARTQELSTEDYTRSIMLAPGEERAVHWIVTAEEDLQYGYRYTFPVAVYTNRNSSHVSRFTARSSGIVVDAADLAIDDQGFAEPLTGELECDYPSRVRAGEQFTITCSYPETARICITGCSTGMTRSEPFVFDEIGARSFLASAQIGERSTQQVLTVIVEDEPALALSAEAPDTLGFSDTGTIRIHLNRTSVAVPEDVRLSLSHKLFDQEWEFERIDGPGLAEISLAGRQLTNGENEITILVMYDTSHGEQAIRDTVMIRPIAHSLTERIHLWFNSIAAALA